MVARMGYIRKHLFLLPRCVYLSFIHFSEYKAVFYANMAQYLVLGAVWIIFWNLLIGKVNMISHWDFPMLILLTGFVYFNQAIHDIFWQTFKVDWFIYTGQIETYMLRPIGTLYAITIAKINIADILPATIGMGIILYAVINYFEIMTIQFILSIVAGIIGIVILQMIMALIGSLGFWVGNMMSVRMIFRSFKMAERYPMDLYTMSVRAFFTFVMPFIFIGTFPVLILTKYTLQESLAILGVEMLVFLFWLFVLIFVWKRGVRRYESVGG